MAYNTTVQALAGQRVEYTYLNAAYTDLTTHFLSAKIDYYYYGDKNAKVFSETEPEVVEYLDYQTPKYKEVQFVSTDADAKVFECGLSFSEERITKQRDAVNQYIPNAFNCLHSRIGEFRVKNYLKKLGTELPFGDTLRTQIVPWNYAPYKIDGMVPADCRGISFAQVGKAYELLRTGTKHGAWQRVNNPLSPVEKAYKVLCILPRALRKYLNNDKATEYRITGIDKHALGLMQYSDLVMYPACPECEFLYIDDDIWLSVDGLSTDDIDGNNHEGVYALLCYSDASRFALSPADGKIGLKPCEQVDYGINGSAALGLLLRAAVGSAIDYPKAFVRIECNIGPLV